MTAPVPVDAPAPPAAGADIKHILCNCQRTQFPELALCGWEPSGLEVPVTEAMTNLCSMCADVLTRGGPCPYCGVRWNVIPR